MKPDSSNLITTKLAWYQHISGIYFPILEKKHSHNMNYINSCWLNGFLRLLKKHGVEVKLRNKNIQPIQREVMHLSWITFSPMFLSSQPPRNFTHTGYISKLPYSQKLLPSKAINSLPLACKKYEIRINTVLMLGLVSNVQMHILENF